MDAQPQPATAAAPRTPPPAVFAHDLVKRYGEHTAVDAIHFEVRRGECFGFLGPNGAGKTSTMKMIYGRSEVTSGELTILGFDPRRQLADIKRIVGVVPQENNLDPDLTVWENLYIYARYFELPPAQAVERCRFVLDFVGLMEKSKDKVDELSGGMKRRLVIGRALINRPQVLVLDEPTTGLDPHARHLVWQQLAALRGEGVTLLLTTHYMEEASRLCDRLVVMDQGRILAEGRPSDLVEAQVGRQVVELPGAEALDPGRDLPEAVLRLVRRTHRIGSSVFLFTDDNRSLLGALAAAQPDLAARALARPATLEDVFLTLAGRGLEE
ncbi:MAG: ABC transporter ATP-binding protein [Symbiobacteriia bacterium]